MTDFSLLHLTDIHFGQARMAGRWPTVKAQLLQDISYVVRQVGVVHLIAVTGDIANRAATEEFAAASEVLEELALHLLEETDQLPEVVVVPGNHDLARPARPSNDQRVIEGLWTDDFEERLFNGEEEETRRFILGLFQNYDDWLEATALPMVAPDHTGHLPGDYTATISTGTMEVGIIGLNSTYRHISDAATEGKLSISPYQVQKAAGGDLPRWSRERDLCIVMTHHPLSWIKNRDDVRDGLFNDAANVTLHLCGHMHSEAYSTEALGTGGAHHTHQGLSLFGLETFGTTGVEDRRHGYALLTIQRIHDRFELTIWPRAANKASSGAWRIDRDAGFGLSRGEDASMPVPVRSRRTEASPSALDPNDTQADLPSSATGAPRPSVSGRHAHEALDLLAGGDMVAVVGDRLESSESDAETTSFQQFREGIWEALSPGIPDDGTAPIEDLMKLVVARGADRARNLVSYYLGDPSEHAIESARSILRAPWSAVVNLSPSAGMDKAARSLKDGGRGYAMFDATVSPFSLPLEDDPLFLQMVSVAPEAGLTKLSLEPRPDSPMAHWHTYARQLLARAPVAFMTDSPTSLRLWRLVTGRDTRRKSFQPPAFLVCPALPAHFEAALQLYGVKWIRMRVNAFAAEYLQPGRHEVAEGHRRLAARRSRGRLVNISVARSRRAAGQGSREYLLGRSPTWGDIVNGYAANLEAKRAVLQEVQNDTNETILVLTGTAGSGRTTALMQCALTIEAMGQRVAWIDSSVDRPIEDLLEEVEREAYDVVFVDDADVFGARSSTFLERLRDGRKEVRRVIGGVRTVRAHLVEGLLGVKEIPNPGLTNEDAFELASILFDRNAVANRRLSISDVRQLLLDTASGQLLVGMIQATSGLPFGEKIAAEYDQLSDMEQHIYGCFSLVTAEREVMSEALALQAAGGDPREAYRSFRRLLKSKLLVARGQHRYEARHRVVAEEVRSHLQRRGALTSVLSATLRAFAAAAKDLRRYSAPERRALIRFLNHTYLIRLGIEADHIRGIYDHVEDLLSEDFHYWLQRGAFEVERGEDRYALHDLTAAMTTPGGEDDHRVLSEFAYLRLRLAKRNRSVEATRLARDAIEDLERVIRRHGLDSPHTYVILARDGVEWLMEGPLKGSEREVMARGVIAALSSGERLDSTNTQVERHRAPGIDRLRSICAMP